MAETHTLAPILIADDEADDRYLLERGLRKAGIANPILPFHDGDELLEYLQREAQGTANPVRPPASLLFLDLKMPMVDGFDALRWIRTHPGTSGLAVVIVSSSHLPSDREKARELGALDYFEKYPSAEVLVEVMRKIAATP